MYQFEEDTGEFRFTIAVDDIVKNSIINTKPQVWNNVQAELGRKDHQYPPIMPYLPDGNGSHSRYDCLHTQAVRIISFTIYRFYLSLVS